MGHFTRRGAGLHGIATLRIRHGQRRDCLDSQGSILFDGDDDTFDDDRCGQRRSC